METKRTPIQLIPEKKVYDRLSRFCERNNLKRGRFCRDAVQYVLENVLLGKLAHINGRIAELGGKR